MAKKNVHVTHRKDKSWAVISEGDERASSLHNTQRAAIKAATPLAKARKSELVIHDRENRIRDKDSYGNHPNLRKIRNIEFAEVLILVNERNGILWSLHWNQSAFIDFNK
jgi:hypothetical protein